MFSKEIALALVLGVVAAASAADLLLDLSHGVESGHVVQEGVVFLAAIIALGWLLREMYRQRHEIGALKSRLEAAGQLHPQDPEVARARTDLANVIAKQFDQWQLSRSEQEVGLLLLKGLSLREIALLRQTSEKTVRQQASSIYHKAGLAGRHEFAAWFIEDFLEPEPHDRN